MGCCSFAALLIRGRLGRDGTSRREWPWFLAFCGFGALGGLFVYACPEGTSAVCRNLEWHFKLPLHHYLHMAAGIAEFACATVGVWLAARRCSESKDAYSRGFRLLLAVMLVSYPLLGVAYLADRLGALIEPVFFLTFTAMILLEITEPGGGLVEAVAPRALDRSQSVDT